MSVFENENRLEIFRQALIADEQKAIQEKRKFIYDISTRNRNSRAATLKLIENVFLRVVSDVVNGKPPVLHHICRNNWRNVLFDKDVGLMMKRNPVLVAVKFKNFCSIRKFSLMLHVMSKMYKLIQTDNFSTKRDLYYQDRNLYSRQHMLDDLIDDISCLLQVPRGDLHVLATSKGCISGDLQFVDSQGNFVDCRNSPKGVLIGPDVNLISGIRSEAQFVLIIEKDATFQKLIDDKFASKVIPSILVTGKGYPDIYTRQFVNKIWHSLHLPLFILVDADPHGIEIMCSYRYGTLNMSFDRTELATPSIRWLGLLPVDIERLRIPQSSLITLSKSDEDKLRNLDRRVYIEQQPAFQTQLAILKNLGAKAEIQSLDSLGPRFLSYTYIPSKISSAGWI